MAEHSNISWTDATWPIVAGCEYESPGCSNCWAVRDSWRLAHNPHAAVREAFAGTVKKTEAGALVWTGLVRPLPERLDWPLKWRKARKVFVCSQADLFHPKVPFEFIAATFGVMAMAPQHTFQVLTKHAARMREFFEWIAKDQDGPAVGCLWHARTVLGSGVLRHEPHEAPEWPLSNVWLGVTTEDQKRADERAHHLIHTPAAKRWLSVEPMLEAITFDGRTVSIPWAGGASRGGRDYSPILPMLDWVVCGGESAQTRASTREFDIAWARDLREQCKTACVAFFMKQLGTRPIIRSRTVSRPSGVSSRYKWHEPEHWPEDLRVQEFPS